MLDVVLIYEKKKKKKKLKSSQIVSILFPPIPKNERLNIQTCTFLLFPHFFTNQTQALSQENFRKHYLKQPAQASSLDQSPPCQWDSSKAHISTAQWLAPKTSQSSSSDSKCSDPQRILSSSIQQQPPPLPLLLLQHLLLRTTKPERHSRHFRSQHPVSHREPPDWSFCTKPLDDAGDHLQPEKCAEATEQASCGSECLDYYWMRLKVERIAWDQGFGDGSVMRERALWRAFLVVKRQKQRERESYGLWSQNI